MKYRLSKQSKLFLDIIFILFLIIGTAINLLEIESFAIVGVIFQIVGITYTAIESIYSYAQNHKRKEFSTPYFTDREKVILYCIQELHTILLQKSSDKIIVIKSANLDGIGETELLKKLYQILCERAEAKEFLPFEYFEKYKRISRRIGVTYFEVFDNDSDIDKIKMHPKTIGKQDIVIIDRMKKLPTFPFKNYSPILIYCQEIENEKSDKVLLERFTKEDIQCLYKKKFGSDIDAAFLSRVYEYSKGNLKLISLVFNDSASVNEFKNTSIYFYAIESFISNGDYSSAGRKLNELKQNFQIMHNEAYRFKIAIIEADLWHYQNKYIKSLEQFIAITSTRLDDDSLEYAIERQSHVNRHLGRFDDALNLCKNLQESVRLQRSLGLNFLSYVMYENRIYYDKAIGILQSMEQNLPMYVSDTRDSYSTYDAVYRAYIFNYNAAHKAIDKAINLYESTCSKFLTNCYFIKAEIYRHDKNHKKACEYYQKCLNIHRLNNDFDIYSLVYALITYENLVNNASHLSSWESTLEEVNQRCKEADMAYNGKLVTMVLKLQDETISNDEKNTIKAYFNKYIFFIP